MVKNLPPMQETQVWSLGQKDPLEKGLTPFPVFVPGEFHGQRSLAGYSPWGNKESDTTDTHFTPHPQTPLFQHIKKHKIINDIFHFPLCLWILECILHYSTSQFGLVTFRVAGPVGPAGIIQDSIALDHVGWKAWVSSPLKSSMLPRAQLFAQQCTMLSVGKTCFSKRFHGKHRFMTLQRLTFLL